MSVLIYVVLFTIIFRGVLNLLVSISDAIEEGKNRMK